MLLPVQATAAYQVYHVVRSAPGMATHAAYGGFWFDCSFFTPCPRVVTLTALQIASAFLCHSGHDYHDVCVRTVQAALTPDRNRCTQQPRVGLLLWERGDSIML